MEMMIVNGFVIFFGALEICPCGEGGASLGAAEEGFGEEAVDGGAFFVGEF